MFHEPGNVWKSMTENLKPGFLIREEWNRLLVGLKSTVEGLLSMPCSNVWSIFGGLDRLSRDLEQIMYHGQKVAMSQNSHGKPKDFWDFVKGLRWLNPVMAPSIERYSKISPETRGKVWIRQSLQDYNIVNQLSILVENTQYLQQYYTDEAFLCQPEYFQCMIICLQAVEQNKPGLLADINPHLLNRPLEDSAKNTSITPSHPDQATTSADQPSSLPDHVRSQAIDIHADSVTHDDEMFRRSAPHDRLAPPMLSAKTDSILLLSDEHAVIKPGSYGSSSDDSAKEALLQLLNKSGDAIDDEKPSPQKDSNENGKYCTDSKYTTGESKYSDQRVKTGRSSPLADLSNDPLMNTRPTSDVTAYDRKSIKSKRKTRHKENSIKQKALVLTDSEQMHHETIDQTKALDSILNCDDGGENPTVIDCDTNTTIKSTTSASLQDFCTSSHHHNNHEHYPSASANQITYCQSCDRELTNPASPSSVDSGYSTFRHEHKSKATNSQEVTSSSSSSSSRMKKAGSELHLERSGTSSRSGHQRSMSDYGLPAKTSETNSSSRTSNISTSVPKQDVRRSSFFHPPTKGESLIDFLSSQDFRTCAELDKENAHFSICETLISAIEQMKWNQVINPPVNDDIYEGDSDEEIQELKQRIRIRKQEKLRVKASAFLPFEDGLSALTKSTGSQPTDTDSDLSELPESEGSSDEIHDAELNEAETSLSEGGSNLQSFKESGLSLSLASLYSAIEIQKNNRSLESRETDSTQPAGYRSAESVAIALLKRFSEKQLPKASELEWLVSEQDAPQRLLPLPDSFPVSPDDNENADLLTARTRIRGNLEWAPPRPQIIFNTHPPPKRKVLLARQNYRCAGCGTKVEQGYINRYRFCEYLGKYFCPCCHSNDVAYIPGKILRKWDFTKYYVSHFARDLLLKIFNEPFFSIVDINPGLYRKVRYLDQMKDYRTQFSHLVTFLRTCRLGDQLYRRVESCPSHWSTDIHLYSLKELVELRTAGPLHTLRELVTQCVHHISQCPLCQAKGFICEFCNNSRDVIFPFELGRVDLCSACRACFHKACFVPDKCPKCIRIESRKQKLEHEEGSD